ncbi:MAG: hypothetical protein LBT89_10680 [Planctomycetaceae bacterium]|jgi:hypothetical protein|nr:hypothetical protein [Planctomycetaceae bacterium]
MDNEKLQDLRKNITELMVNDTLQPFEVDYLKKHYAVDDTFIFGQIDSLKMAGDSAPADSADSSFTGGFTQWIYRKNGGQGIQFAQGIKIAAGAAAGCLVLYLLYAVAAFMLSLPGKLISGGAYQRGVGAYTVKYAARSYNGAKWKPVVISPKDVVAPPKEESSFNPPAPKSGKFTMSATSVCGWDKDNFAVSFNEGTFWFRGGKWYHQTDRIAQQAFFFLNSTQVMIDRRIYDAAGYKDIPNDFYFHLTNDIVCSRYYTYNIKTGKIEASKVMQGVDRSHFGSYGIDSDYPFCPFKEGKAIACWAGSEEVYGIVPDKRPEKLYDTRHSGNSVRSVWAIDNKNFVLAGSDITVYRNGQENHPILDEVESFSRNSCKRVWGNSMDLFWIADERGNIAEFRNGQAGKQIVKSDRDAAASQIWVSPEGTVFGCFNNELYRLE